MPRLIDDVRRLERLEAPWYVMPSKEDDWAEYTAHVFSIVRDNKEIPVILADNVSTFYWEASDQEHWSLDTHFPNMAPPYPLFWIEYKLPSRIHSGEKGDTDLSNVLQGGRIGWLIIGVERKDVKLRGEAPEGTKWVLCAERFVDWGRIHGRGEIEGPAGAWFIALDEYGRLLQSPSMMTFSSPEHNEDMSHAMTFLHPALLTISFMHCKNVTVEDNTVPPKLAKRYEQRHGAKPTRYKTLVIEPLKTLLRREGKSDTVGVAAAMHICRGHFKDYRQGSGLFGKVHDLVWFPQMVRGTKGDKAPPREIKIKV